MSGRIVLHSATLAEPQPARIEGSPFTAYISVALILESLAAGMTIADIVDAYPSLTEAAVRGALPELSQRKELQAA